MLTALRVQPTPIGLARILFAVGAAITSFEGAVLLTALQGDDVTTPVATWTPSADSVPVLVWFGAMALACSTLLIGLFPGASAAVVAVGNAVLMTTDHQLYSNHRYLLVLVALSFVFARSDHALAPGAGSKRARDDGRVPWWPQLLIVSTVSACYLFAGLSKANPEFLSGELIASMSPEWVPAKLAAHGTVLAELAIGVGLWWSRLRAVSMAVGVGLHASIVVLLDAPLVFAAFALICFSAYPLAARTPDLAVVQADAAATQRSSAA